MEGSTTWRAVTAAAAVLSIASAIFAVGAAVSSDDDDDGSGTTPAAGTTDGTAAAGTGFQVSIAEFAFDPADLSAPAGSTIRFTNDDNVPHTVRSADGVLASPELASGDIYSVVVSEAGTIEYICSIHDFMSGSITVSP